MAKSFGATLNAKATDSQNASIRAAKMLASCKSVAEFNAAIGAATVLGAVINQTGEMKGKRLSGANDHTPEEQIRVATQSVKAQGWTISGK